MSSLRIATVQFALRPEETFARFERHVTRVVERAAAADAELVVLPELVGTGLLASYRDGRSLVISAIEDAYHTLFPELTEAFVELARSLAVRTGLWLCAGSHYRAATSNEFRNTAYLAHPDGQIETQDKLHLTPAEAAISTTPGDEMHLMTIRDVRVAIQICADIEFPELTRYVALEGADLVLCPSLTWNRGGINRVRYSCLARAVENQIFVACAPLIGTSGIPHGRPLRGVGRAFVGCPIDRVFGCHEGILGSAQTAEDEEVLIVDLDLEKLYLSRAEPSPAGLRSLRPDLYERLRTVRKTPE